MGGLMIRKKSFTMIELVLVAVVITIIAAIALPNFYKAKVRALQKEAISNIKLIAAAQRVYRMEQGFYADCTGTGCNSVLKLMLNANNWAYSTTGTSPNTIQATRGGCTYSLDSTNFDASPTGTGCN